MTPPEPNHISIGALASNLRRPVRDVELTAANLGISQVSRFNATECQRIIDAIHLQSRTPGGADPVAQRATIH